MRLFHYLKNILFDFFSSVDLLAFWATDSSMPCKATETSEEKSLKNQQFFNSGTLS